MQPIELIPFRQQCDEYPAILELFKTKPPKLPPPVTPPWRVYGKKEHDGKWAQKEFDKYKDAYRFVRDRMGDYYDLSIHSKRQAFAVPSRVVRVKRHGVPVMVKTSRGQMVQKTKTIVLHPPPGHRWCIYCRRFTIFTYFRTHHAFTRLAIPGLTMNPSIRRCCLCGISEGSGAQ